MKPTIEQMSEQPQTEAVTAFNRAAPETAPELKIKFVGKTEDAPDFITDGNLRIELPKDQSKPFAHEHAKRILKVARELYKPVVKK